LRLKLPGDIYHARWLLPGLPLHSKKKKLTAMKKNMGTADRIIRIMMAAVFTGLYFTNVITGWLAVLLIVLSVIFLLTGFVSFCPLYLLFGINTSKTKN
jgi:Protein of unknown function (DUF2892)